MVESCQGKVLHNVPGFEDDIVDDDSHLGADMDCLESSFGVDILDEEPDYYP